MIIINTYNKKVKYSLRRKDSKTWLYNKKNYDTIFFSCDGKKPSLFFYSIEETQKFINEQLILANRRNPNYEYNHWNLSDRDNYDEPIVTGDYYEIQYNNRDFTLFCYDTDKIIEYEIVVIR